MSRPSKQFLPFSVSGYFHYFMNKDRFMGMCMYVSLYTCKYS